MPTITTLLPHHGGDPFFLASSGFGLQHQALATYPWLVHGFSLRRHPVSGKELDLSSRFERSQKEVETLRNNFVTSLAGRAMSLVLLRQSHSDQVHCLDRFSPGGSPRSGDALITHLPQLLLAVQVADCLPVLIADEAKRVVAAVHAGWRGILGGIVPKTVERMRSQYSSSPRNCVAIIGPSIGPCCYEVGEEVAGAFDLAFAGHDQLLQDRSISGQTPTSGMRPSANPRTPARRKLNLSAACRCQLEASGLHSSKIFSNPPCTSCHRDVFFSYRAERRITGRMLAAIGKIG